MTTEEVGAYILLLCKAWRESPVGSIPADDAVLARWTRQTPARWAECKPKVLAAFKLGTDSRWHQRRMRNDHKKLMARRKKRVNAAIAGALAKWGNGPPKPPPDDAIRIPSASQSTIGDGDGNGSDIPDEEEVGDTSGLSDIRCVYCGATEKQVGRRHHQEHFHPRSRGGDSNNGNVVVACCRCNYAKQDSVFESIEDCKTWLHWRFWVSDRQRYVRHRPFAFGGMQPSIDVIRRAKEIHSRLGRPSYHTTRSPANTTEAGHARPPFMPSSEQEAVEWASMAGVPADFAKEVFHQIEGRGGVDGSGQPVTNWRSHIAYRWSRQRHEWKPDGKKPERAMTPHDIKTIIAAKEAIANELKAKFSSEVAMGVTWDNEVKRDEWRAIKREIKELTVRLSQMV